MAKNKIESKKERVTLVLPRGLWRRVKGTVPKGEYSDFFADAARLALEERSRDELAGLAGKVEMDADWQEMEDMELRGQEDTNSKLQG